ncbi:MAG: hypothetical protein RBT59_10030 [Arcobacteraceae bacterium]|jgi:hypothetical protein|nr:hypothetical protein [Arcobacteraceae bacterium]
MDEDEKFEHQIKQIEIKDIRVGRSPSVRMNNFYSLATILIMSVVILWYSNYVLPAFEKGKQDELRVQQQKAKQLEEHQKREAQIELSRKLNTPKEDTKK